MPEVFPFAADLSEPLAETHGYLTDVLTFESGPEQRVQLRRTPLESVEFSILASPDTRRPTEHAREQALLDAFLFSHQPEIVAVPLWQFANRLTGNISIGAASIPVPTTSIPYRDGGYALVWKDTFTWELFTIDSIAAGSLTTVDTATLAWTSGQAIVVPVRLGRLSDRLTVKRLARSVTGARLRFSMEAVSPLGGPPTPPATGLPTYLGLDVLEIELQRDPTSDEIVRHIYVLDNETGARGAESPVASPALVRPLTWMCFSREEAATMRAFIDNRRGRAKPFWMIAREDDLELSADVSAAATSITILESGYTSKLFPALSRQDLALRPSGGAWTFRRVTGSVDNGNGTETLTFAGGLPAALPRAGSMVCFLRCVRLDTDEPRIQWTTGGLAEAELPVRDLPFEVPLSGGGG